MSSCARTSNGSSSTPPVSRDAWALFDIIPIRKHLQAIAAWARTRQTNGFLEALNGLFQSAKRKARGYKRFDTIRIAFFLIAGKLDFHTLNPHTA